VIPLKKSSSFARMAELADALALGASGREAVQVQVLFRAPENYERCNSG
jgi:hypothetical protein